MADTEGAYLVEEVKMSESQDDFDYQSVQQQAEVLQLPDQQQDYQALISGAKPKSQTSQIQTEKLESKFTMRHQSTDDFVRNFLVRLGMTKTIQAFQAQWYQLTAKGKLKQQDIAPVPDVYLRNQQLRDQVSAMRTQLQKAQYIAQKAKATWDKLRKQKDFHRMHHQRVQQQKQKLINNIDKLKRAHQQYQAKYKELANKYEAAMKEKMLMKLERDRLRGKVDTLQQTLTHTQKQTSPTQQVKKPQVTVSKTKMKRTVDRWPNQNRPNPFANLSVEPVKIQNFNLNRTYKGHQLAISALALHPRKPILATASDDHTWKMWNATNGELIMSGQGHTDWVAGITFNPRGTLLATCSGDQTVKLWDFVNAICTATFTLHTQAVWSVDFHDTGEFLVSGSMDHSLRLWDLNSFKCRQSYRGHVDSVNFCKFQPYSNSFASASGDKTVSMWDMRTAQCVQTFYGHLNSVNHVSFAVRGDSLASCDSDGVVKVWDVRMVQERIQFDTGQLPANASTFDKSGNVVVVASQDGNIYAFSAENGENLHVLRGHQQGVQDLAFDVNTKFLLSAGADATFRLWQQRQMDV